MKLEEFIEESEKELSSRKEELEVELKKKIYKFVEEKVLTKYSESKNIMLQGRVKGTGSLAEKIVRKRYADKYNSEPKRFIDELPDLIGLRIVCLLQEQEEKFYNFIKELFSEKVEEDYYAIEELVGQANNLLVNHSNQPETQQNGKPIFRLACKWITESERVIYIELQIKSLINMFWGEIEHMLFYKNYNYMVGSSFYKEIMETIHESLVSVDSQLQLMSRQLSLRSDEDQFLEMKQSFAKLMYNMFSKNYKSELTKIDVDLREIYDLLVQIEFKSVNTLTKAQTVINSLITNIYSHYKFSKEQFSFEDYKVGETILQDERKKLGEVLGNISNSNDLYWKAFIGVYKMFKHNDNFTEVIDSLANDLMSFYTGYNTLFELEDDTKPGKPLIKKGVELGIIYAFSKYKKLDFFLKEVHQEAVFETIYEYIFQIKDRLLTLSFEEVKQHGENEIITTLSAAVFLLVYSKIERKINIELLEEINNQIKDIEFSGVLLDIEKLESLLSLKKVINAPRLQEVLIYEETREEE